MEKIQEAFTNMFKCLVKMSRPNKQGIVTLEKVELLWKEREDYDKLDDNEHSFLLAEFLGGHDVPRTEVHPDQHQA